MNSLIRPDKEMSSTMNKLNYKYFQGCLIGGAIGDSLGAPIEFLMYDEIIKKYGANGVSDIEDYPLDELYITDDTQMSIFTAEGLIRSFIWGSSRFKNYMYGNRSNVAKQYMISNIYRSYLRWMFTQGENVEKLVGEELILSQGWIMNIDKLYFRRAPGNTCLGSLLSGNSGEVNNPINNSKGCGGVMRIAPVGLLCGMKESKLENAFKAGCDFAAITHGHSSGYLAAGVLATIITGIIKGNGLMDSINYAMEELKKYEYNEEVLFALEKAIKLAKGDKPSVKNIELLGEGWVAEEALAISVYCALSYTNDFKKAIALAINHSGDSDSTGAITGNILGAFLGIEAIPNEWINRIELIDELKILSNDLLKCKINSNAFDDDFRTRYPI